MFQYMLAHPESRQRVLLPMGTLTLLFWEDAA